MPRRTIYKYPLPIEDEFAISMPKGAEVLCVQIQHGQPCIWALLDATAALETRAFSLRGTGHPCNKGIFASAYIGTFQLNGGSLVFHLFERREASHG